MHSLTNFEQRWFGIIIHTLLPASKESGVPTSDPYGQRVRQVTSSFLQRAPWDKALGFRLVIWLITFGSILWRLKLRPIPMLSKSDRVQYLQSLDNSSVYWLRELPTLMKMVGCLALFSSPATHLALGASVRGDHSDSASFDRPTALSQSTDKARLQ